MSNPAESAQRRRVLRRAALDGGLALATVCLLIIRRPDQFTRPATWVEEGSLFFTQYLAHGWLYLFEPINGYLILPSKIAAFLATQVSFLHYPEASIAICVAATIAAVLCIAHAPTLLKWPPLCALLAIAVPTDPEVLGVSSYLFWIFGLVSLLSVAWRLDGARPYTRLALTIFGGLSSPLNIALTPLFFLRAGFLRTRREWWIAGTAIVTAALQTVVMRVTMPDAGIADRAGELAGAFFGSRGAVAAVVAVLLAAGAVAALTWHLGGTPAPRRVPGLVVAAVFAVLLAALALVSASKQAAMAELIAKFFGGYFIFQWDKGDAARLAGLGVLLAAIVYATWRARSGQWLASVLCVACFGSIAASLVRMDLTAIDPGEQGQRYFFYPFVFLSWLAIDAAATLNGVGKLAPLAVENTVSRWSRIVPDDLVGAPLIPRSRRLDGSATPQGASSAAQVAGAHTEFFGTGLHGDAGAGAISFDFPAGAASAVIAVRMFAGPDASNMTVETRTPASRLTCWRLLSTPERSSTGLTSTCARRKTAGLSPCALPMPAPAGVNGSP